MRCVTVRCQLFDVAFSIKKFSFCGALFKRIDMEKRHFQKVSSQNEVAPLLIVFHLPYSKYKGVKICFYSFRYKIIIFQSCRTRIVRVALVSHSYRQCSTGVALVLHSCCQCRTRVAFVSLVSVTRVVNQTRSLQTLYSANESIIFIY